MINCTGHPPPFFKCLYLRKRSFIFPYKLFIFSNSAKKSLYAEENVIIKGEGRNDFLRKYN